MLEDIILNALINKLNVNFKSTCGEPSIVIS